MNPTSSIRDQACPNERCIFYKQKLAGNVISHGRSYARFKCNKCGKTWVASRYEFSYGFRKNISQLESARELFAQNISIRKTAQAVGICPGTAQRWKHMFVHMPVRRGP